MSLFSRVDGVERVCFGFSLASEALAVLEVIITLRFFGAKIEARLFEGSHRGEDKIYGLLVCWGDNDLYSIVDSQRWAEEEAEKYLGQLSKQANPAGE